MPAGSWRPTPAATPCTTSCSMPTRRPGRRSTRHLHGIEHALATRRPGREDARPGSSRRSSPVDVGGLGRQRRGRSRPTDYRAGDGGESPEADVPMVGAWTTPAGGDQPRDHGPIERRVACLVGWGDQDWSAGWAAPDWMADQVVTVEQGLDLLTRAGAYATFEEDRGHASRPGSSRTFVILSDDPRAAPSRTCRPSRSR